MLNVSKPTAYVCLAISIILECCGSTCIEACNQFEDKKLTLITIVCYTLSFGLFSKILHVINLAIAYATWTGLGAVITSVVGVILFDQAMTVVGWISIAVMGVALYFLNTRGTPAEEKEDAC